MTEIIAENSPFTSDLQAWLAAERSRMDSEAAAVNEPLFSGPQRARMRGWSLNKRLRVAIQNLTARLRGRRDATPRRLRRVVLRAVRRDRRTSPATAARAADSGGSSGDPDPDPEPSRPRKRSRGGAL